MNIFKSISITALLVALLGCTGKIVTTKNPTINDNTPLEGVLYYSYKMVEKKSILDRIRQSKTGDISHSMYAPAGSPNYCEPVVVVELVPIADYSKPFLINYKPALFETRKFSVSLDKGMLSSVNSESTPGHKTALESLQLLGTFRENLLDGITTQTASSAKIQLENIGGIPNTTAITCTSDK